MQEKTTQIENNHKKTTQIENVLSRLREFFQVKTSKAVALKLGISEQAVSNWKKRGTIDYDLIREKAEGVNWSWLMTGEQAEQAGNAWSGLGLTIIGVKESPEGLKIPVMLNPASCGDALEVSDDVAFYYEPGKVYSPEGTLIVEAKGKSMVGVLDIHEGDWLVVDLVKLPYNGCVVLARVNDGATIKRLRKNGQDILLTPDNPAFNPIVVNDKNARILGVITEIKRML